MQEFTGTYPKSLKSESLGTFHSNNGSGEHRHGRFGVRVKYLDDKLLQLLKQGAFSQQRPHTKSDVHE